MALEIQKGRSKWWYGRVTINGKQVVKNLGVEIKGVIPGSLRETGDAAFERSRERAQVELERLQSESKRKATSVEIVQTLHEIRTGSRISSLALDKVFERWEAVPRRRTPSPRYVTQVKACIDRFFAFLAKHNPSIKEMSSVQAADARLFLESEEARGVSAKTYNNVLVILRSVFLALARESGSPENPFDGIPTKEGETIFRKPFTKEELGRIIKAAEIDPFIKPIIITGICTAMRRGDCCMLPWTAVDLEKCFINVKTSKTGETVQIPIFPMLEKILRELKPDGSNHVFPEQAEMYRVNPDGITYRVRKVLEKAGFHDDDGPTAEADKTERNKSLDTAKGNGNGREFHQRRATGLRKASIRDFHSFRVTWVTLALTAGVPIEIVQRVTGHRTSQIVQKHYFQPGAEDFRRTLTAKMPALMGGKMVQKKHTLSQEVREKLESMTTENWEQIRDEILSG